MKARLTQYALLISRLGLIQAINYIVQVRRMRKSPPKELFRLSTKHAKFPLFCRAHSSDLTVFGQIFLELEYSPLSSLKHVDLVIDCGANVGYSSAYFLSQFPSCKVIAVEPDKNNFAVLERNLKPYGDRARVVNAGIWSHPADLTFSENSYRDKAEWAHQVRECLPDEPALFSSIDIETLRHESGQERISILKMDIEGAEVVVFSCDTYKQWIDRVDAMAVEIHNDTYFGRATEPFTAACGDKFTFSRLGELTFAKSK